MDIVIRAAIVFVVLWFVIRITGKREMSQLSAFELILLVTLGDLIGQTVLQEDFSLTGGVLAVSTFALLSIALSYVTWRFPRSRPLIQGRPTIVIRDGVVDEDAMRYERLPMDELFEAAREHGVRSLGEVELGVLETDGRFSFFTRDGGEPVEMADPPS